MAASAFELWTAGALLVLAASSVQPSPVCPVAEGDSCHEVRFFLWTRSNPVEAQEVSSGNISASLFDRSHPTKMIIHGYASGMNLEQLANIRKEYLARGEFNVICPQYLELVDSPCYLTAVVNVDYVGKCIARFIQSVDVPRMRPPPASTPTSHDVLDMHLVGFSLGAQTAAFTANHLKPQLIVERITGLDPAMPFFTTSNKDRKLSEDDALFVDVLHTNAYMQGQAARCGRVDFYMNGGMLQPGCTQAGFFEKLKCDHHRAPVYFAESIRSRQGFWGWRCGSIADYQMGRCPAVDPAADPAALAGEWVDYRSEGFFVVETASSAPFARGLWWENATAKAASASASASS